MDFVEQLKSSIDIVKVVGEYVRLKRLGATGRYVGLCPFHQEKTGSFNVNQARQYYKCFGCGVGGDVLKFVMEIEGYTFPEALKTLAERHGIPMPKRAEYSDADSKFRAALLEIHSLAAALYREALSGPSGSEARAYLNRRGLSADSIQTFELGYSEPGNPLLRLLSDKQFTREQVDASGLVRRREDGSSYFDFFRGRLMFPIHNESGKVIAFGGRAMRDQDQPKYLNSSETPIYKKTSVLYNLHRAREAMRRTNRAVLVEGYMDVIGVYSAGVKEVVASCGTALTSAQARIIRRLSDTVVVRYDSDSAGQKATERTFPLLRDEGLHIRVCERLLTDAGLDPDDFIKQRGADEFRQQIDSAATYIHWLADHVGGRFDLDTPDGRMDAFKIVFAEVEKISDKLERAAVANDLAGHLRVDPALVLERFKRSSVDKRPAAKPVKEAAAPALERMLLGALLASAGTRLEILPRLTDEMTAEFVARDIFDVLRQMAEAGATVTFSALEQRLQPPQQALLHAMFAADDIGETADEAEAIQMARSCLKSLEGAERNRRSAELRARIKAAEREGRLEEALALMAEMEQHKKK